MAFKSLLDYFGKDNNSNDKIIINNNLNSRRKREKIPEDSGEIDSFLANFCMPKATTKTPKEFNMIKNAPAPKKISPSIDTEQPPQEPRLLVYTDGSCILNGKPNARGAWAVYFPGGEFANMAEKLTNHPTNQRCELTAIWRALETIKPYIDNGGKAELYTDSEYSIKCLTEYCRKWSQNGWIKADKKTIENRDIIEPLYGLYTLVCRGVQIKHIRAHTGNQDKHSIANDMVDQMARQAIC